MSQPLVRRSVGEKLGHTTFVVRLHPRHYLGVGEVVNRFKIGPLAVADPAAHFRHRLGYYTDLDLDLVPAPRPQHQTPW